MWRSVQYFLSPFGNKSPSGWWKLKDATQRELEVVLDRAFLRANPDTPLIAIAEMVYGEFPALMDQLQRRAVLDLLVSTLILKRRKFAKEHLGFMTRIAKQCKVSHSLVSRVLHGQMTSKRVSEAIDCEIRVELERQELWKQHVLITEPPSIAAALAPATEPSDTGAANI